MKTNKKNKQKFALTHFFFGYTSSPKRSVLPAFNLSGLYIYICCHSFLQL